MNLRPGLLALGLLPAAVGCEPPHDAKAAKPTPPAAVAKPVKEETLGTITLEPAAEKRLGVQTAEVKQEPVARSRSYAGDVMVPPGGLIVVSAPFIGTIKAPKAGIPSPGMALKRGQPVLAFLPSLSPESLVTMANARVTAEGQIDVAKAQLQQAEDELKRVEALAKGRDPVLSQANVVDAKNKRTTAYATLRSAENLRDILETTLKQAGLGSTAPIELTAPEDGILRNLGALEGQQVAAGAILFDVERVDPIWIKVPVFVGDRKAIAVDRPALVGSLADPTGASGLPAQWTTGVPIGDPLALTVFVFYELPNHDHALSPGQKVGVSIPMKGEETGLVVPKSAVVTDYYGGTWVYEQVKEHTYVRRRVEVERIVGDSAILTRGAKPGMKVMTVGVAEVFGTELGFAK